MKKNKAYICPMHSEVSADEPGRCPKCGMSLVEVPPEALRAKWGTIPNTTGKWPRISKNDFLSSCPYPFCSNLVSKNSGMVRFFANFSSSGFCSLWPGFGNCPVGRLAFLLGN